MGLATKKKEIPPKNVAIKLEGGKAFMAGPLKKELFAAFLGYLFVTQILDPILKFQTLKKILVELIH